MSRHYGSPMEQDYEPDTREPDPETQAAIDQFYADILWEPTDEPPSHHEELDQ